MSSAGVFFERDLIKSEAWRELNGAAKTVYVDFLMKRTVCRVGRGRNRSWVCTNNGEIEFTYSEAEKKGFTRTRFQRSLDILIERGFIDIAKRGGAFDGDKTHYTISERWRKFGTPQFQHVSRVKDLRSGKGWAAYHRNQKAEKVVDLSEHRERRKREIIPRESGSDRKIVPRPKNKSR